jgi:hypothetical protein
MGGPRFETLARSLAPRRRRRMLSSLIGVRFDFITRAAAAAAECPTLSPCWHQHRPNPWSDATETPNTPTASKAETVPTTVVGVTGNSSTGSAPEPCSCGDCDRGTKPAPPQCPTGLAKGGGVCVNLSSDPNNCDAWGTRCHVGQTCSGGTCTCRSKCARQVCSTVVTNGTTTELRCNAEHCCC